MADHGQKTEKPTQKRLNKARQDGQFAVAREFVAAMQFLAALYVLRSYGGPWFGGFCRQLRHSLMLAFQPEMGLADCLSLIRDLAVRAFLPLGIAGALLVGATLAAQLVTTGLGVSSKRLMPSFKRFNPLARLKQLPKQNAVSVGQSLLLLAITAILVYNIACDNLASFLVLPLASVPAGASRLWDSIQSLLWKLAGALVVFGAVDLLRTRLKFARDLRMSKQEVKDEHKETEGDPQIKGHIRRLRRDMLRKQMMKDVAKATVVVVNPTHYAVAIRYEMEAMASPQVVAKGRNYLAVRIRERAMENAVPIVENPPLARALYKSVEVGHEIPANFYRAVAEVLAYIFKMMNQGREAHRN